MDIEKLLPYRYPPSVAIIGDVCLDLYYFTGKEGAEISAETGLQSSSVYKSKIDAGGAGNTAINCKRLGAKRVDIYGIAGNDIWSGILKKILLKNEIETEGVLNQGENWQTHVFHKIYEGKNELPRYDMGNQNNPDNEIVDSILNLLKYNLEKYDCVIINEQVPQGIHSPYFQEELAALIEANREKTAWFCDCRKLNDRYAHTIRKLNIREANEILAANGVSQNDPRAAADWLYNRWGLPLALTMGEEGALIRDENGCEEINSIHFNGEIDIVGAGDAFLAGLVTAYGAKINLSGAAKIGALASGVSLGKLYETGHPSVEEVIALTKDCDFNYNSRIANKPAHYMEGTEIEIISPDFKERAKRPLKIAIFDHDGTISVLRQGWEDVMFSVMTEAVTGKKNLPAHEIENVKTTVRNLIEKTTGIQTLAQMYMLSEMVISFGYVQETEALSPQGYKDIYNKALLAGMEERFNMLKEGKLKTSDVSIAGAVEFLERLSKSGVTLYLASGTDQEDAEKEAKLLGYADLFNGGIYGSLGDINNDPKKVVIGNIISGIKKDGGNPCDAAVFGDGPVEMREARKAGLLAVGILSDERRRRGVNQEKRRRLVLGGADILIPDFSCSTELMQICGWE